VRIHFHTECYWFSGSETTLMVLLEHFSSDPEIECRFTYVPWPEYEPGLSRALPSGVAARPLKVVDPASIKAAFGGGSGARGMTVKAMARCLPLRQVSLASSVRRFTRLFERERPDVLHINNGGFPGAISCNAAAIAARRAGVPAIVYVVNNMAYGRTRPSRVLDVFADVAVRRAATRFVTGSEAAGRALDRVLHLPPGRREVIPNTIVSGTADEAPQVTRQRLGLPASRVIAVLARLEERKGHRYVLEALAELRVTMECPPILVVAGTGPCEAKLRSLASSLGLDSQVRFVGHAANVWNILQVAEALVLPSIDHEDFPIVILEAMAAGLPVVASRVAGVPEQIRDGETGFLTPPGDARALASALRHLLSDESMARGMGQAGKMRFEELFAPAATSERYAALYQRLLGSEADDRRSGGKP